MKPLESSTSPIVCPDLSPEVKNHASEPCPFPATLPAGNGQGYGMQCGG
jgi:hypothetical protein